MRLILHQKFGSIKPNSIKGVPVMQKILTCARGPSGGFATIGFRGRYVGSGYTAHGRVWPSGTAASELEFHKAAIRDFSGEQPNLTLVRFGYSQADTRPFVTHLV